MSLDPGESAQVTIDASIAPLATVPGDAFSREELGVQAGEYRIVVDDADVESTLAVE